jgi:hypothetical protein
MTLIRFAGGNLPTTAERLKELMGFFETATTDGDLSDLAAQNSELTVSTEQGMNNIGDVYQWLLWALDTVQSREEPK